MPTTPSSEPAEPAGVVRPAEPAAPVRIMPAVDVVEFAAPDRSGWGMLGLAAGLVGIAIVAVAVGALTGTAGLIAGAIVAGILVLAALVVAAGLTPVTPGQARVLQLLGRYVGTIRTDGLRWVNPLTDRKKVSTRIRNHETSVAKVNDADGNPIEIAAVVVWQVADTAQATFAVDDLVHFVGMQAETAVRHVANTYPYDVHDDSHTLSLRDDADEITDVLGNEIAARVVPAGVQVIETRITHLAYAPEIAGAMLRRQQAGAVVAARQRIVEGAVGMVEMALERLEQQDVVDLDEERKAQMVSNLLVVLCSEREASPIVNAGSLY